jgi:hypothetical protein
VSAAPYFWCGEFSHATGGRLSLPIVQLRRELGCHANIRPTLSLPLPVCRQGIDLIIVRENTEDLYVGDEQSDGEVAVAIKRITRTASLVWPEARSNWPGMPDDSASPSSTRPISCRVPMACFATVPASGAGIPGNCCG